MSLQEGPCQEVGNWAALVLGGSVLLCVASNAICLLASPPPRPPRSRSVRYQAPRSRSPQRKLTWEAASDRGGGRPAKRVCSTCRCSSQPGRRRAGQQHRPKGTATGSARTRRSPEAYGSYWLGPPVAVLEKRTTRRTPPRPPSRRPRSRSASPREGSRARGHVLILRAQPNRGQQQWRPRTPPPPGAPLWGHVIYARQAGFSA